MSDCVLLVKGQSSQFFINNKARMVYLICERDRSKLWPDPVVHTFPAVDNNKAQTLPTWWLNDMH